MEIEAKIARAGKIGGPVTVELPYSPRPPNSEFLTQEKMNFYHIYVSVYF